MLVRILKKRKLGKKKEKIEKKEEKTKE